uniref:Uncharacterized protein n=1 Tax=Meloidogyne floridensis TaxID=298350 RepID=A0A915NKK4_9BILA
MTTSKNNSSSTDSFDVLENEFDKAFVDLDVLIGEVEHENSELSFECRRRLTRISGIFVQFVHKVAIMNQHNCELEKDLQNSNNKLIGVLATNSLLEEQSEQLLLRVHSLSCQLYSKTAPHESEIIKKKLDKEMRMFNTKNLPITKSQAEISLLKEENLKLKSLLNSVHSEIYGARLAAKYLDKELAGRFEMSDSDIDVVNLSNSEEEPAQKIKVIDFAKSNSIHAASRRFDKVARSTVQDWLRQEKELRKLYESSSKTFPKKRLPGAGRRLLNKDLDE